MASDERMGDRHRAAPMSVRFPDPDRIGRLIDVARGTETSRNQFIVDAVIDKLETVLELRIRDDA